MAEQRFEGRTIDAEAPFLGAEFWEPGKVVTGIVSKVFETSNMKQGASVKQRAYVLILDSPVDIGGEDWDKVSIGSLAGFKMAIDSAGIPQLLLKDVITIECEGKTESKKEGYSPRLNFKISVTRNK